MTDLPAKAATLDDQVQAAVGTIRAYLGDAAKLQAAASTLLGQLSGAKTVTSGLASGATTVDCPASLAGVAGACEAFARGRQGRRHGGERLAGVRRREQAERGVRDAVVLLGADHRRARQAVGGVGLVPHERRGAAGAMADGARDDPGRDVAESVPGRPAHPAARRRQPAQVRRAPAQRRHDRARRRHPPAQRRAAGAGRGHPVGRRRGRPSSATASGSTPPASPCSSTASRPPTTGR